MKIIAIDGPSSSGKSTIAAKLAKELNMDYLPTGKIFRLVAKNIKNAQTSIDKLDELINIAKQIKYENLFDTSLENEEIAKIASQISSYPELRKVTSKFQVDYIKKSGNAVVEGRDIGTVIWPQAEYKFFVTADLRARAERRYKELKHKGLEVSFDEISKDLEARDIRDKSRKASPLVPANDAIIVDTTNMGIADTLRFVLGHLI